MRRVHGHDVLVGGHVPEGSERAVRGIVDRSLLPHPREIVPVAFLAPDFGIGDVEGGKIDIRCAGGRCTAQQAVLSESLCSGLGGSCRCRCICHRSSSPWAVSPARLQLDSLAEPGIMGSPVLAAGACFCSTLARDMRKHGRAFRHAVDVLDVPDVQAGRIPGPGPRFRRDRRLGIDRAVTTAPRPVGADPVL